jgi:hypothetical protein
MKAAPDEEEAPAATFAPDALPGWFEIPRLAKASRGRSSLTRWRCPDGIAHNTEHFTCQNCLWHTMRAYQRIIKAL